MSASNQVRSRTWRLLGWIEEDREFLLWCQRLRAALHQWETSGKDAGALLRGAPLTEAELWLSKRPADLSHAERDFIRASLTLRELRVAEQEVRRQRELEAAQKRVRELNARFADWYYVIPEETYTKLRIKRDELFEEKKDEAADAASAPPDLNPSLPLGPQFQQ